MIEEIDPERFLWEYYCQDMLAMLDSDDMARFAIGYCDAKRLSVRPRGDLFALMVELPNGEKMRCHVEPKTVPLLQRRRQRLEAAGVIKRRAVV